MTEGFSTHHEKTLFTVNCGGQWFYAALTCRPLTLSILNLNDLMLGLKGGGKQRNHHYRSG